jgi:ketosteroid isomerase-like protein
MPKETDMKFTRLIVLLAGLAAAFSGHGARAEVTEEVQRMTLDRLQSWNIAFNNAAMDNIDDLYTSDAVLMTPSGEAATGTDIADFWQTVSQDVGFHAHGIDVVGIEGSDDLVIIAGHWAALRAPENETEFTGNMVNVLERQTDGSWKLSFQSWN